ncbi:MAG: thymidylate synthase [Archaeoglobaceae archaeon]|nr:thymidylate synthase [Archaeoglobaceae archaeon]MCX8151471.1 thymidylate synthase [Archaeoglobaceae archaeon]MDW8014233.1 thymidylate synthase [Archaeoglobaceae archaeon]
MILAKDFDEAKSLLTSKVLKSKKSCRSRFGNFIYSEPTLVVLEKVEDLEIDRSSIYFRTYEKRFEELFEVAEKKLKNSPYTRRVSIPIWRPEDHYSENPPAITEISFLFDGELHLTAYLRSLEVLRYFEHDYGFLSYCLQRMSERTGMKVGTIAMLLAIPHVYERDVKVENLETDFSEFYGYNKFATHIVEDYISSAWHSALEFIYKYGKMKKTEWEFEKQKESLFVHRMFIEVKKPEENVLHDKAPFDLKYAIDYTMEYVLYDSFDKPIKTGFLKGEEYSYAERARFCEKDKIKVDQLYEAVKKLKDYRRDCYVCISRPWDLESSDPPCLRGYQFFRDEKVSGIFYMRSNDVYGAMHANMFAFSTLTKLIADYFGSKHIYYHFAVDAHVYQGSLDLVKEILYGRPKRSFFS